MQTDFFSSLNLKVNFINVKIRVQHISSETSPVSKTDQAVSQLNHKIFY